MDKTRKDRLYHLVGQKIRKARRSLGPGHSQEWLAEELGMTRTSVVNFESARQHPSLHMLWEIADKLNVPLALLLPTVEEYNEYDEAIRLDPETVARIEAATVNNPLDRHFVTRFVASKSKNQ